MSRSLLLSALLGVTRGLVVGPVAPASAELCTTGSRSELFGRRAMIGVVASSVLATLAPAAHADTQPMLDKPMEKFETDEARRAEFIKKQKVFKKAWRKELSNLEFASNDAEATEAIESLIKLIVNNGMEIPEGVRKQDMDQVYRTVKDKLQKDTRLKFQKLDQIVLQIVTVKNMGVEFQTMGGP